MTLRLTVCQVVHLTFSKLRSLEDTRTDIGFALLSLTRFIYPGSDIRIYKRFGCSESGYCEHVQSDVALAVLARVEVASSFLLKRS